jgi:ribose transport system ATP-binding protein
MNVKTIDTEQPVLALSGGNQQKVAMARLLHQEADILLMDEPTRGIDVVSKSQIYEWMGTLASRGKAIIFVSSYIPELLGICDRIAVFYRGKMKDIRSAEEWTIESLTAAVTLGRNEHSLENR